jgi:regulator of sirC expression with transglutaminase-like and TPR domain
MARAAAKRKPAPRHDDAYRKKHKDSSGQRYEDTLFFNRLRTHAKWVFVLLIVVFGLGFVLFGVGSSVGGSGLSDIFNGIRGAGGNPSIDKPLKRTETNPKDAQAWKDLATAYDVRQEWSSAIPAWQTYVGLRPKDPAGLQSLAGDLQQQFSEQGTRAAVLQQSAQSAQPSTFGPPSSSPLGRAYASQSDPIATAIGSTAQTAYQTAYSEYQATAVQLVDVYKKLVKLTPDETGLLLQLAQVAQYAGDVTTEVDAYTKFLKLAPDDPSAPQVRATLKALKTQQQATASTATSGG